MTQDVFGAKQVWLAAVVVFVSGSLLCGLAWSSGSLIASAHSRPSAAGLLTPVGTIIIARAAGPQRMGRVMALMGVPLLLGPVLGPVVGGVLIQSAGWRCIFFINLPIGVVALVLGRRLLPATPPQAGQRLDLLGLALVSPGLALLIYGVSKPGHFMGSDPPTCSLVPLAGSCSSPHSFSARSEPGIR